MARNSQDKPADEFPSNPWPLLAAVTVFAVGIGFAAAGHWRRGALAMASGMALAGVLRLVLPTVTAGLLVVRRRWVDVVALLAFAAAIAVLAVVVPPGRPG